METVSFCSLSFRKCHKSFAQICNGNAASVSTVSDSIPHLNKAVISETLQWAGSCMVHAYCIQKANKEAITESQRS